MRLPAVVGVSGETGTVDAGVWEALAQLDGTLASAVSLLADVGAEQFASLGGLGADDYSGLARHTRRDLANSTASHQSSS